MILSKLVYAILVAVATAIVCLLLAAVLDLVHVNFAGDIADILRRFAPAFGVLAGIVYYIGGRIAP